MTLNSDWIRVDHLTFEGWKVGEGYGWFGLGKIYFPQTSEDRTFCMTFLCLFCLFVCLFFQHYTPFFFFSARIYFVEIRLQDIIFILKSPIPPPHSKVQWSAPKKTLVNRIAIPSIACEQQTYFRWSASLYIIFRRERSDDRKYVCCSRAIPSITVRGIRKLSRNRLMSYWGLTKRVIILLVRNYGMCFV